MSEIKDRCICDWSQGMGPDTRCPEHGLRNVPAEVPNAIGWIGPPTVSELLRQTDAVGRLVDRLERLETSIGTLLESHAARKERLEHAEVEVARLGSLVTPLEAVAAAAVEFRRVCDKKPTTSILDKGASSQYALVMEAYAKLCEALDALGYGEV